MCDRNRSLQLSVFLCPPPGPGVFPHMPECSQELLPLARREGVRLRMPECSQELLPLARWEGVRLRKPECSQELLLLARWEGVRLRKPECSQGLLLLACWEGGLCASPGVCRNCGRCAWGRARDHRPDRGGWGDQQLL